MNGHVLIHKSKFFKPFWIIYRQFPKITKNSWKRVGILRVNHKVFKYIKKSFEDVYSNEKYLLNFSCLIIKFHNCHYAITECTLLTTDGDGTCILGTALGLTWLATWQSMTPSAKAAEISWGMVIRSLDSISILNWLMCASAVADFSTSCLLWPWPWRLLEDEVKLLLT